MEITKFIEDFKNKKVIADPSLPKYQALIKEKVKEVGEEIVEKASVKPTLPSTITNEDWANFFDGDERVPAQVSSHVKELLSKNYTDLKKFIKNGESMEEFNSIISDYLKKESGWGVDLRVKGDRPGATTTFHFGEGLRSGLSFEDQVAFNTISSKRLEDSRPGWLDRLLGLFSKKYYDRTMLEANKKLIGSEWEEARKRAETINSTLTIEDFFSQVKIKTSEEQDFISHLKTILSQISYAKKMGQAALLEKLAEKVVIDVYEGALYANDLRRFITLEDLKELADKSPHGISIDFVQNFTRIIPVEVVEKKELVDQLKIFDQYVILHFDPERRNVKDTKQEATEKEEARKKDPILFGLILDSDKLYYVADWIDEFCDLTWDKMMEILGKESEEKDNFLIKK